jgi:acyl-CoA thioester hydrolase
MPQKFISTRRMEFSDTDVAGIVHFSRFFIFMETAEHELLRSLGWSVMHKLPQGHLSWPRVAVQCDYKSPAQFEELLTIETFLQRLGEKSVTYSHCFKSGEKVIAQGLVTAVCCLMLPDMAPTSQRIPDDLRAALTPYVA